MRLNVILRETENIARDWVVYANLRLIKLILSKWFISKHSTFSVLRYRLYLYLIFGWHHDWNPITKRFYNDIIFVLTSISTMNNGCFPFKISLMFFRWFWISLNQIDNIQIQVINSYVPYDALLRSFDALLLRKSTFSTLFPFYAYHFALNVSQNKHQFSTSIWILPVSKYQSEHSSTLSSSDNGFNFKPAYNCLAYIFQFVTIFIHAILCIFICWSWVGYCN